MRFLSDGSTTATPDHTRRARTHARTHFLPLWCKSVSRLYGACECVCVCLEGSSFAGLRVSYCESQSATTGGGGGEGWVHSQIFSGNETRARREEEEQQQDRCPSPTSGCRVQLSPSFARNPEDGGRRAEGGRPTDRCWPTGYPRVVACEGRGQASPVANFLDRRRPPAQIPPRQLLPSGAPSGGTPDSCWPGWSERPRGYYGAI